MDRRSFLSTLAGAGAALAFDPERLLWVPGAKRIFIPAPTVPQKRVLAGICLGLPVYCDDIDESKSGPLFFSGPNIYRHVELLPRHHIGDYNNMIFAIPGGKLEILVKGYFFPELIP